MLLNPYCIKNLAFSLILSLFSLNVISQKKSPKFNNTPGHALYKRSKLYDSKSGVTSNKRQIIGDKAADRIAYEFELLKNPTTGKIPKNIRQKEKSFSNKLPKGSLLKRLMSKNKSNVKSKSSASWAARGPGNVGGRTRALALDLDNEDIVFAGGVSGGLWRSINGGTSWNRVTAANQNPGITAIVQDPRAGSRNIWYYASGEHLGNSASLRGTSTQNIGALYQGTGIYKSTDSGLTWTRIVDTNDMNVTSNSDFDYINGLAVNPLNGDLYFSATNGVYRIKASAPEVVELAFDANLSFITEVNISPTGKIYVTASKEDGQDSSGNSNNIASRISVSTDGDNWTDITPSALSDATLYIGRIVIEIDPSDENFVWIFADNIQGDEYLYRYQVDTDTWVDRSSGLPKGQTFGLNTQGGFNMMIKVHPSNSDIVFLGGTNLYRSNNGFTTEIKNSGWIGGYSLSGAWNVYPNHHPDQHNLVFLPSNPSNAISATDGGLHFTQNILSGVTSWESLNNNYLTTHPYAVSFDPSGNSDNLLAGFQDNGSWYGTSTDLQEPWYQQYGGDGAYNAIADNGNTLYVSSQFANVYRLEYDSNSGSYSSTKVTPSIASGNFSFITPFLLDHNNDNIMYMPRGGNMLVNYNLDGIPSANQATTSTNWFTVNGTTLGSAITAMDVSTYPVQHRLYFGAALGGIFRVDNANLPGAPRSGNLAKDKGMGPGRISCIYVDPTDDERVFVTKSNYGVKSIWMTENAGETWKNISGNLEENSNGSGNGPSVRWFSMIGNHDGYIVGTSTGLYYTETIDGNNTIWTREVLNIGTETIEDALVVQVKTRSDGFAAAATHGNGMFSANFAVKNRPKPTLSAENVDYLLINNDVGSYTLDIEDKFTSSTGSEITLSIESNSNPNLCTVNLVGSELQFTGIDPTKKGKVDIVIRGTSGIEFVKMIVRADIRVIGLYEQATTPYFSTPSNYDDLLSPIRHARAADDFVVPEGETWTVDRVLAYGTSVAQRVIAVNNAEVEIMADDNGKPGEIVYTTGKVGDLNNESSADRLILDIEVPFPEPAVLQPGNYWISVFAHLSYFPFALRWEWMNTSTVVGREAMFINPEGYRDATGNIPGNTYMKFEEWTPQSEVFLDLPTDHVFFIMGESNTLSSEQFEQDGFLIYPNPNKGEFTLKFKSKTSNIIHIKINDITGRNIYHKSYTIKGDFNNRIKLDDLSSGVYMLEASDGISKTTRKIVIE